MNKKQQAKEDLLKKSTIKRSQLPEEPPENDLDVLPRTVARLEFLKGHGLCGVGPSERSFEDLVNGMEEQAPYRLEAVTRSLAWSYEIIHEEVHIAEGPVVGQERGSERRLRNRVQGRAGGRQIAPRSGSSHHREWRRDITR